MKKNIPAFLAALIITAILGAGMFVVGQDTLDISTSQAAAETNTTMPSENLAQLEQILAQYQTREVQYQTELDTAIERLNTSNQQLSQANQQIQEYQSLLVQLQKNGFITVSNDGTVTINQPSFVQHRNHPERNN